MPHGLADDRRRSEKARRPAAAGRQGDAINGCNAKKLWASIDRCGKCNGQRGRTDRRGDLPECDAQVADQVIASRRRVSSRSGLRNLIDCVPQLVPDRAELRDSNQHRQQGGADVPTNSSVD